MRAALITVSTSAAARASEDASGPLLAELAEGAGWEIAAMDVIADDFALIEDRLNNYVNEEVELIVTTGGTGLTPDDVTPEASAAVIERPIPGIGEALRAESLRHTPHGMLSREVAGVAGRTLIVNLPGSPRAVRELWTVLEPVLAHAVATIRGDGSH